MENVISLWASLILSPSKALQARRGKGTNADAALVVLATAIVSGIILAVFSYISAYLYWLMRAQNYSAPGWDGAARMLIIYVPLSFIGFFVMSAIIFVLARLLGGRGSFSDNIQLYSLVFTLMMPASFVAGFFGLIPCVGQAAELAISLALMCYLIIAVSAANSISILKSIAIIVALAVIALVLTTAVALLLYLMTPVSFTVTRLK